MLTAIKIGNFKAFAETQRIPIRPLTLIYGANSSGKSSILHSLIFARHAQETGNLDIFHTNIGGESVDLGGFRQFIHKREVKRRMEWYAELDKSSFYGRLAELFAPIKTMAVSLTFGIALDDQERPLIGALPELNDYEILGDNKSFLRMSKRRDGRFQLDRLDHEHIIFHGIVKAIVETSTTTSELKPSDFEGLNEVIAEVVPKLVASFGKFLPEGLVKSAILSETVGRPPLFPVSVGHRKEDLAIAIRFFIPRLIDELINDVANSIQKELLNFLYLGPLRSYPQRHLIFSKHNDPNWVAGGGYAWDIVIQNEKVRLLINEWLSSPDRLQTPYKIIVRDLFNIDQLRDPILKGLEYISENGLDMFPDYDDNEFPEGAYPAIKDIEKETKNLQNVILTSESEKIPYLTLMDKRSNTIVSPRDIGVGISQVLPVLAYSLAYEGQIIAIEQPEIHLHPAIQADLADIFIESALGERRNTFLIETHSEHLLLRIMRRMRETNNGELSEGIPPVRPEDVSVLFVQPKGSASVIYELRLDNEGFLIDPWPGGFFEEGFKERFGEERK